MTQRLPMNANDEADIETYFNTRAKQLAIVGFQARPGLIKSYQPLYLKHFTRHGTEYVGFYVPKSHRGMGYAPRKLKQYQDTHGTPIVTTSDCGVVDFLEKHRLNYLLVTGEFDNPEYKIIQEFYGDRKAERSGAFLMDHIDDGLRHMRKIGASPHAVAAFCLHPMFQADKDLAANEPLLNALPARIVKNIMEYRNIANAWLSDKVSKDSFGRLEKDGSPKLSPISDVNAMLYGDKHQNFVDFIRYHYNTHPRRDELYTYFLEWIAALDRGGFRAD